MKIFITFIVILIAALASAFFIASLCHQEYKKRLDEMDRQWQKNVNKLMNNYDDIINNLRNEVVGMTDEVENKDIEIQKLIAENKILSDKYNLKTATCDGLKLTADLWHEAYGELENSIDTVKSECTKLINNKEAQHQKEIEELTNYYREKINEIKNSNDISEKDGTNNHDSF